jgi:catechol 2,3-dioxygenase-like lactoylglutathione lyase family enzyme
MKISKLLHAAILVSDLARAREFYEGVLGLKEKARHSFDFEGVWYELGENELHLMVGPDALPPAGQRPRRDFHVALLIDDYEAAKARLAQLGIAFREGRHGLAQLFVRDPDGNLIELQQRPENP